MIETSQTFYDNSVYKYRNTKCEITIDVDDLTAKDDIDTCVATQHKYFNAVKIYNDITEAPNYATGELDEFKLDGSMTLLPNTITSEEIGLWTNLSNANGLFTTNPTITFNFDNVHETSGISCFYDTFSYPLRSVCRWYNGSTLLASMSLEGSSNIQVFEKAVSNYDKVVIEFTKAKPYAYVKLIETNFGVHKVYDGDYLTSASITEEVSTLCNQIYSKKLEFNIKDYDSTYDFFNPEDLMKYFKNGQICKARVGVKNLDTSIYEYVDMGTYYLDEKSVSNSQLKITAYGILNILNNETYYSKFFSSNTVEYVVNDILGNDYDYYIHDNVKNKLLTGYIPRGSKKEALKYVCIAVAAICKEGRDGTIYIYRPTEELSSNQLITEDTIWEGYSEAPLMYAGIAPIFTEIKPQDYILDVSRETILSTIIPTMIGYYYQMNVKSKKYVADSTSEELFNDTITTDSNGNAIIEIEPSTNVSVSGISNYTIYADTVIVSGTANTDYTIVINGKKYEETEIVTSVITDTSNAYDEEKLLIELDSCNNLITEPSEIGKWYLSLLQKRNDISFKWWSVATVEAGDTVNLETSYNEFKKTMLTSIKYDLCGLIAECKGVC